MFQFSVRVVKLCQELGKKQDVARTIGRQLLRSGTSIGANTEEAQGAQSRADLVHKSSVARKEARETHYWLRLLGATELVPHERPDSLTTECDELIAILTTIVKKAKDGEG